MPSRVKTLESARIALNVGRIALRSTYVILALGSNGLEETACTANCHATTSAGGYTGGLGGLGIGILLGSRGVGRCGGTGARSSLEDAWAASELGERTRGLEGFVGTWRAGRSDGGYRSG